MNKDNPYLIIGYTSDEINAMTFHPTIEQVKKVYRKTSAKVHPDKTGGDSTEMQKLNEALSELEDDPDALVFYFEELRVPDHDALKIALSIFDSVLEGTSTVSTNNVFDMAIKHARKAILELVERKDECYLMRKRYKHMTSKAKLSGKGVYFFHKLLREKREANCETYLNLKKQKRVMENAIDILSGKSLIPREAESFTRKSDRDGLFHGRRILPPTYHLFNSDDN